MTRTPRYKESLPSRVLGFFNANPGEELTYDDICTKFSVQKSTAMTAINRLKVDGLLESVHVIRLAAKGRA